MHNFVCSSILTVHHWKKNRTEKIAVFLYESIAVRNYTLCCPSNYSLGVFFLKTLLHNQLLIIPIVQNKSLSGVIRFLCNSLKLEIITLKKKQSLGMVLSYFMGRAILRGKRTTTGHIVAGMGVLLNPYRCLYMIA